jgi:hypothetical protein
MRRIGAALAVAALAATLAACGGGDEGDTTITVMETNTVPAGEPSTVAAEATTAESAPAETTAEETTAAEPTTSEEPPTESSEPEPPTTEAPPATTIAGEPTDTGPQQQFTIGNDPATGEEPPPTNTGPAEEPPQTSEEPEPGVERPADFPRPGEQRILSLLAADIANQCTRTSPDEVTRTANVSVYCDLRAGDRVQAWYEGFPSRQVMERAYARFRNGRGITPNTRACQPDQQYPAEAPWYQGDPSNILGRLVCFVEDGDVWLVWSDQRNRTLGWAVNRGGKKKIVWDYWAQRGALAG